MRQRDVDDGRVEHFQKRRKHHGNRDEPRIDVGMRMSDLGRFVHI